MGCGCEPKKYNISLGCCVPVLAPVENYYTKTEVDELIESAITSGSCCITPEEVDEKIASAKTEIEGEIPTVPTSNTAFTNDAGYITGVDLSNYATLDDVASGDKIVHDEVQEVDGKVQTISGDVRTISGNVQVAHAHLSAIDNAIGTLENGLKAHTADTSIHFTTGAVQTQINNSISGKADISYVDQSVSGKQSTLTAGRAISINNNTVALDLPIYKGSGSTNVSIGSTNGTLQGGNRINSSWGAGIGWGLETQNTGESSIGSFNQTRYEYKATYGSSGKTCFTIGNGTSDGHRHNALEIRENGDIYIPKTSDIIDSGSIEPTGHNHYDCRMVKLQDTVDAVGNLKFVSLTQADYDALVAGGTTDANTIYFIKNS